MPHILLESFFNLPSLTNNTTPSKTEPNQWDDSRVQDKLPGDTVPTFPAPARRPHLLPSLP